MAFIGVLALLVVILTLIDFSGAQLDDKLERLMYVMDESSEVKESEEEPNIVEKDGDLPDFSFLSDSSQQASKKDVLDALEDIYK